MLVPLNWLKEYVEIDVSPEELGEMLTMAGLELEALHYRGKGLENIIVAQIKNIDKHPNADRLSLCIVTDGTSDYKVVCGASNMKAGDLVALATIGTILPPTDKFIDGLKIKKSKIRGEVSEGMLCAENELGLSESSDGIMILPDNLVPGTKLVDALSLNDPIFELAITPNRPDCLSIYGIAREVAAILGKTLKQPEYVLKEDEENISSVVEVDIKSDTGCLRYSCRYIEGVKIFESPDWLKNRLLSCGIRSINNVVDITNYVLLEFGQPLHAFDHKFLKGKKIIVKFAENEEIITTLDGVERKLTPDDLLICDEEKSVALGGIMGGLNSEVKKTTKNVLLESAYFDPPTIRKTSKRTGLRSDSSYRFERGVDPNNVVNALNRAAFLILELAGGKLSDSVIDVYKKEILPCEVEISVEKINRILGIKITTPEIVEILKSLKFEIFESDNNILKLLIPTFRVDITRDIDVIEEVGRMVGYNNIPTVTPYVEMTTSEIASSRKMIDQLKQTFITSGFFEAVNYSFEDPELIKLFSSEGTLTILNPLTTENSDMRNSLLPGLIKDVKLNLSRQVGDVRLYEVGKIFIPKPEGQLPKEEKRFTAISTGKRQPELWDNEDINLFDLKSIITKSLETITHSAEVIFTKTSDIKFLHPGKSSNISIQDTVIGIIGELHPDYSEKLDINKTVNIIDIDLDKLLIHYNSDYNFTALPKFPSVRRDISLIVDKDISAGEMIKKVNSVSNLVEESWIFDYFQSESLGKNKKSVGISILLRSDEKTLTDEDANEVQKLAINELNSSLGAELRS